MPSHSGRIDGAVHRFPLRVYYEDTDAAGIVYYANYLKFAERARTEWMRLLGASHSALASEAGAAWAVRRCEVDYLRPARLDDEIEVRTRILAIGGASAMIEQIVACDGVDLARLTLRLAFITPEGRPRRLPADLHATMGRFVQPQSGT
ncbi:MAG: tol-pal system-associated acyl-CoA thioesterase [Alphaproteobacteria bacterium]